MKTDDEFKDALAKSHESVALVLTFLLGKGGHVEVKPSTVRPDFESRMEYMDDGDIEIRQRIEVKHKKSLDFTCWKDYPYDTVIVDEQYKVDKLKPLDLWGYVMLNKASTHVVVAFGNTMNLWGLLKVWDKPDKQYRTYYVCRKNLCYFCKIGKDV